MQHSPPSSRSPRIPLEFPHPRHGQHHAQTLHRAQRNPPFWPGQRSLQHVRTVAPHTTTRDRTQRVTVRPRQPHRSAHCRGAQVPAIRPQFGAAVGSSENVLATGSRPSASYQRSTLNLPEASPASPAPAWGLGLEWVLTAWRETPHVSVRLPPCGCLRAVVSVRGAMTRASVELGQSHTTGPLQLNNAMSAE